MSTRQNQIISLKKSNYGMVLSFTRGRNRRGRQSVQSSINFHGDCIKISN